MIRPIGCGRSCARPDGLGLGFVTKLDDGLNGQLLVGLWYENCVAPHG